jgi:hypothetical protein
MIVLYIILLSILTQRDVLYQKYLVALQQIRLVLKANGSRLRRV